MRITKFTKPEEYGYRLEYCCTLAKANKDFFSVRGGSLFLTGCPYQFKPLIITHCPFCGTPVEVV